MLACAVARWTPLKSRARLLRFASADHLCRRQANVELVGSVREALTKAGCGMPDVDVVLVGRGPGSFTVCALVLQPQRHCLRSRLPLFSASHLMRWHGLPGKWHSRQAGCCGDAMRGEVYPGIYLLDDEGAPYVSRRDGPQGRCGDCRVVGTSRPRRVDATGNGLKST